MLAKFLIAAAMAPLSIATATAQDAAPAPAQAAPAPAPGAAAAPAVGDTVLDSAGATIGTVESVTPQAVTINAGSYKVPVPPTAIGKSEKGWSMAMTKAQVDSAVQQAQAASTSQVKSQLVAGTAVKTSDGGQAGTVKEADAQYVTLTTAKGDVKLPVNAVGASPEGGLALGMTQAQFDAAISGAAPAPGAAPAEKPAQ